VRFLGKNKGGKTDELGGRRKKGKKKGERGGGIKEEKGNVRGKEKSKQTKRDF